MKKMELNQMENLEGGGVGNTDAFACGAGVALATMGWGLLRALKNIDYFD